MKKIVCIAFISILFLIGANITSATNINTEFTIENAITIQNTGQNYALILYGYGGDGIFIEHHKAAAQTAYDFFESQGYFLPKNQYDKNKPIGRALPNTVKDYIINDIPNNLGNEKQIFIFITCHGSSSGGLYLTSLIGISAASFKNWIDVMENNLEKKGKSYSCLTFFIQTCYAGVQISYLSDVAKKRIIITSTDSITPSYYHPVTGKEWFSEKFFESLGSGSSYGEAWEDADALIDDGTHHQDQNPKISDNYGIVGSSDPDKLSPSTRLSLRAYPTKIVKSKTKPSITFQRARFFEITQRLTENCKQLQCLLNI